NNQLSLAIGRRGQNVRLASQLTGWDIDILTEQEESERRQADFENSTRVFMEALNVDEVVGQLLASEGFTSVEELALVDVEDLAGCATDDLIGWTERKEGGEPTKHPGILDANEISRDDAENLIMQARVIAGWITQADLDKKTEAAEAPEGQPA